MKKSVPTVQKMKSTLSREKYKPVMGDLLGDTRSRAGAILSAAKIVVVEDDMNVAEVLKARLTSFGYEVVGSAASGSDAIELVLTQGPDLVLMDIMLEGDINGIEAAEQIGRQSDVPIVFITCLSDQGVVDRAIAASPYGYIVKPYDMATLRSTIEIALVKSNAFKERELLIEKLEKALLEVKRLRGLLPICAACKKIRDEQGRWHGLEDYFHAHSVAEFSHTICPECRHKLYPELE